MVDRSKAGKFSYDSNNFLEFFDKGLRNVIDSFERAREWADLSNCLQKVKKQID